MSDKTATTSITLKKSTKERLESLKGKKDWNTFLEELYSQKRKREGMNSLAELRELLDDRDLDRIAASSRKFRREFKLG
jgi:hypothetical protein